MEIAKKKFKELEKRVADLEEQVQSQQGETSLNLEGVEIAKLITRINDYQKENSKVNLQV